MKKETGNDLAVSRITALWAFSESGMGGILHAMKMPFTGIFAGGFALILLCLLAHYTACNPKKMLSSLLVVLVIKAGVSPHSPFPAYFAVSFQAVISILIYRISGINFFSVFLACMVSLLESAFQKLLFLTLFFGENFWKAIDKMVEYASRQVGLSFGNGSFVIILLYGGIYFLASIPVSILAFRLFKKISEGKDNPEMPVGHLKVEYSNPANRSKKNVSIWGWFSVVLAISIVLWIFKTDKKIFYLEVFQTLAWSLSAMFLWFVVLNPFLVFLVRKFLKNKKEGLQGYIGEAMEIFPAFSNINALAWQNSKEKRGFSRMVQYLFLLIYWCINHSERPEL